MFTILRKHIALTALLSTTAILSTPCRADKEAADLLSAATAARDTWPRSFPGFTAKVHVEQDSKAADGVVTVGPDGTVDVAMDDPALKKEVTSTLRSLVLHRMAGAPSQENPSLGPTDSNPQGRAILLNDTTGSLYRIRDNQILQVNRTMGAMRFTIDVLRNRVVEGGKYLPAFFTVTYRDSKTGALQRTETFEESYTRVGGLYLPATRREVSSSPNSTVITAIALADHKLLGPVTAAK